MKFLFKVLVLPILTIIAIPLIFALLLYKSVDIPVADFTSDTATATFEQMVVEQLNLFLEDHDEDSAVSLGLTQKDVNLMLKDAFSQQNPRYMDASAPDDEKNYVLKEDAFGFQGAWVRFEKDYIEVEAGIHIFISSFTYKTALLMRFKVEADTEEIVLTLSKLNIGRLPLAWAFGAADWAVGKITGNGIDDLINSNLGGIATFDPKTRKIVVNVDAALDSQDDMEPDQRAMISTLLAFVRENELIDFKVEDQSLSVALNLGKLSDRTAPYTLLPSQKLASEDDLKDMMESRLTAFVLSSLSSSNPYLDLDELTLNKIIEYMLRDQQASPGVIQEFALLEDFNMVLYLPYIKIIDNKLEVHIPLRIVSIADGSHYFQTILVIDGVPSMNQKDLVVTLGELKAGLVSLSSEHMANLMTMLGDSELFDDGKLVIKDFDQQMNQAGMSVESVGIVNQKLRMYIELNTAIPLQDIQDEINSVLGSIVNDPNLPDDMGDAISSFLDEIAVPNGDPEQAIEDMLDAFAGLDEQEQQAVFDILAEGLDNSSISLEDLLGLAP